MSDINYNNDRILYPLTHPQKRIWYIEKIYPGTSLYNIGGTVRVKGLIDFSILEEAINTLIKNNEGLRLRFCEKNKEAKQYISYYEKIKLDFNDFSKDENPEDEFNKWVEKEARKSFLLENERLFYFALFRISDNDNGYLVKFHHIISDGWSINIMTEYICNEYMKLFNGEEITNSTKHSYIEYISNEEKYLLSNRFLKNKLFWNEKFKNLPETFLNKSSDIIKGKRKTFQLDPVISFKIKEFAADNKCSLNIFFIMLYLIYIYKTTQQEEIVIGTPVYNRSGKKEKNMFGMFTSTMPFRFAVDDNLNVMDSMVKISKQLKECYFNQKYPYDLLVQDLELKKKGYDNLFNTCVNYYNTKLNSELNGVPIENVEFYNGNQIYSLQLVIKEWSDSGNLTLEFDYKINDYSDEQIYDMYVRLLRLANYIIMNPFEKVRNLSLLSNDERKKLLYDFNATEVEYPKDKVIYQLFEEQIEKTPDKIAICFNNSELTYRKLNEKANQLARHLIKKGVGKETIVGLLTTQSIETAIGILGILKAGGAYLPIDYNYPNDRIYYILEDSGSRILLTNIELLKDVGFKGEVINLNNQDIYSGDISNLECVNKPNDIVYVLYTSGSTGKPKGTMIEHQSLVNYVWWAKKMYVRNEDEVFPLYSSLAFDLTVTSIFTPLISGSLIVVYDENNDDEYVLFRIMKDNKATVIKLTPSHLSLLKNMDNRNSSVRRFIVGGEDLKVNLAKDIHERFNGKVDIYNEYGPTETVVGCMIHKFDYEKDAGTSVPIGIPAENVQIYILDDNLNPVPINTRGEIYISGDGVERGYLNKPELTKEKLIMNPFLKGKRMYKTGDSARFLRSGKIEYIGRMDHQVKIRGHRVETGEIEKCLMSHESVRDAVVIFLEGRKDEKYLCAYIVNKKEVLEHELREFLLKYLPDYMLPTYYISMEKIPLTINGKISKELLPKPYVDNIEDVEFIPCRTEKEKNLVSSVCDVLNLESVSVRQNFYRLGGDSIKAIQIASKLNDKGFKIKVKDMLSNPIIEDMALQIEENKADIIEQKLCEGSIKPSPITSWFFEQHFANPNYYNQSVYLKLKKNIDVNVLIVVFEKLIKHHDMLRVNYNSVTKELYYNNKHLDQPFCINEYDLSDYESNKQSETIEKISEGLKASFDLEKSILIKACIFHISGNVKFLLITAHHLVVDGVSWRIILDDIYTMLKQLSNSGKIKLPKKTHSYQKWAELLDNFINQSAELKTKYLHDAQEFSFPVDFDMGDDTMKYSGTVNEKLSEEETRQLLLKANSAYNTTINDLLVVSLAKTIKEYVKSQTIYIEIESHGREERADNLNFTRTVGWFTEIDLFRLDVKHRNISSLIKSVKEQLRNSSNKIDRSNYKERQIRLNYLGDLSTNFDNDFFDIQYEKIGLDCGKNNLMTSLMDINVAIENDRLYIEVLYSNNNFKKESMEKFLRSLLNNLRQVIEHCCSRENVEFTTSDFDTVSISQTELDSLFS